MPDKASSPAVKTLNAPQKALIKEGLVVRVSSRAQSDPIKPIKPITLPEDLNALPLENVSAFVQRFAMSRDVHFKRTGLDSWAEAVTRASGDDVTLDETGKLLVALKKKNLINGHQMARLMSNHLNELCGLDGAHSEDDNMACAADDALAKQRYEEAIQLRKRSQQG
ncbi:hypothetical protein [Limnohabitans sp. Rim8]|uniref:hypothetical protein n=1 Tax=Limnohabitans sp. Rim8 TaxID=1100718 RepID=UPI002632E6C8|nr:hypothetical protein [Limnohabitans sp. Rim8]